MTFLVLILWGNCDLFVILMKIMVFFFSPFPFKGATSFWTFVFPQVTAEVFANQAKTYILSTKVEQSNC